MGQQMYDVRIRASIQWQGAKTIDHEIRMTDTQLSGWRGQKRTDVFRGWLAANYPGATCMNYNNFSLDVKKVAS